MKRGISHTIIIENQIFLYQIYEFSEMYIFISRICRYKVLIFVLSFNFLNRFNNIHINTNMYKLVTLNNIINFIVVLYYIDVGMNNK